MKPIVYAMPLFWWIGASDSIFAILPFALPRVALWFAKRIGSCSTYLHSQYSLVTNSLQGLFLVVHTAQVLSHYVSFLIRPLSDKHCHALREMDCLAELSILSCEILASISTQSTAGAWWFAVTW